MLQLDKPPGDLGLQAWRACCDSPSGSKPSIFVCTTPTLSYWHDMLSRPCLHTGDWTNTPDVGLVIVVARGPPHSDDLSRALRDT